MAEEDPKVATKLEDVSWFERVLESSRADLEQTPTQFQPSWYRSYESESTTRRG